MMVVMTGKRTSAATIRRKTNTLAAMIEKILKATTAKRESATTMAKTMAKIMKTSAPPLTKNIATSNSQLTPQPAK